MAAAMQDPTVLNEKYTLLCADKCKLLNSIESVSRESKTIKKEICAILDLISEFKTDKELEELDLDSDSEMSWDPIFTSFLNSNNKKRELEKIKKIQSEINGNSQKSEKKPKRKSPKKTKADTEDENENNTKDNPNNQ